ncbi:MAG TPA: NADH-quinone oxidoreductase subunit C [Candidatus Methylomirabilis sp.]|nr:NADH-quinone oxidoreductase subunit C [Candidatus Methylomirabilis sp.]
MNTETALQQAELALAGLAKGTARPTANRLDVTLDSGDLLEAATALRQAHWGYFAALSGVDLGKDANALEALYHFCEGDAIATLRAKLPRSGGSVPSLHSLHPNAVFYERELLEMFGITVTDLPDTSHLFLPDGWPEGVYPLLKDVDPHPAAQSVKGEDPPETGRRGNRFVVPIGPQHPALKEPGHFEFTLDGELVTEAKVRLGYVHRGIEKATEERNYVQNLYLVERVCGICSHSHANAYALGVEQLAGVQAPPRAQAIREIVACLERVHSHLLWLGVASHEAGFDTLFMYSWRDREVVMDLLEELTGNRVNYSASVLGGVKFDISPAQADSIRRGLDTIDERTRHYVAVATTDESLLRRTRGIGTLTKAEAAFLEVQGPVARASGVARDVRTDAPYGGYKQFPVKIVLDTAGDLAARFKVRLEEIFVSTNTVRTILDHLPEGDLTTKMPRRIPPGETISRFEAPRGELFYYIRSNGTDKPDRVKIRTPSICNWISVLQKAVGSQLADVPPLLAGIDPCFSCNDRSVVINRPRRDRQVWTWEDLRQYANKRYRR